MAKLDQLKQLRAETSVSLSQCKKALEESGGDIEKAKEILRQWGQNLAGKKSQRETGEGIIDAYIHANKKLGVLLDLRCETDFVARNEKFGELAHEIALHIAAMAPLYVKEEDIPEEVLEKEKGIFKETDDLKRKPEEIKEKIIAGKLQKFKKENSLLSQSYVKDPSITIQELIGKYVAEIGENITVAGFFRMEI
jgi:elongation factor Ts